MKMSKLFVSLQLAALMILGACQEAPQQQAGEISAKISVKVVIVAMFDSGAATSAGAGEFNRWVSRTPLDEKLEFKVTGQELRINREKGVLGVVTGIGTIKATSTIMALGLDERFDLGKAYWLIAGISGIDPADGSIGSAAWAEWIVDGDLAHHIDAREMPKDWTTGYFPLRRDKPYEAPTPPAEQGYVFQLNPNLTEWAYQLTKDVKLEDTENMQKHRAHYTDHPLAQRPPFVLKGDHMAAMTYWHGEKMNEWANGWVSYWTEGKGNFVTSAMEDSGSFYALKMLENVGKVDTQRVMVLRTASNYAMQSPGTTAEESLNGIKLSPEIASAGFQPSLEAAYQIGVVVVDKLLETWDTVKDTTPSAK